MEKFYQWSVHTVGYLLCTKILKDWNPPPPLFLVLAFQGRMTLNALNSHKLAKLFSHYFFFSVHFISIKVVPFPCILFPLALASSLCPLPPCFSLSLPPSALLHLFLVLKHLKMCVLILFPCGRPGLRLFSFKSATTNKDGQDCVAVGSPRCPLWCRQGLLLGFYILDFKMPAN